MNYRARIVGATLEISSELGDGTVVTCTLPETAAVTEEDEEEQPVLSG
jgi:signal transduction histidine kinase